MKTQPVLGGYDPAAYTSARLWATRSRRHAGPDLGRAPPRRRARRHARRRCSTATASYEHSIDPTFRASRLSLLDRGFVFAIAHVRGGGELGREWYEDGRLEHKANTFTDFIACAEAPRRRAATRAPDRLVARGGSAGGLLMGAVANLRPDLFAAIVAEVPFVDVVTTMLDPTLPLTITEWEEWGDPREPDAYACMKAYSPYDNVRARRLSRDARDHRAQRSAGAVLGAGEVGREAARARRPRGKPILLRTEMGAGHGGPSGRYDAWRDEAMVLAFVCDVGRASTQ